MALMSAQNSILKQEERFWLLLHLIENMNVHHVAQRIPKNRNCISVKNQRNRRRFRTDRCVHVRRFRTKNIVAFRSSRSTKLEAYRKIGTELQGNRTKQINLK